MATDVDICNLALTHVGDIATVTAINPPDGSIQAGYCATFYPIARDALLSQHPWDFATRRVALALLTNVWPEWDYAYQLPSDCLTPLEILPPDAIDDFSQSLTPTVDLAFPNVAYLNPVFGGYVPQHFECERDASGNQVILSDQQYAVLRYTYTATDTGFYPAQFVMALSYQLAAMLAGPLLKGDAGVKLADDCLQKVAYWQSKATVSDANQRRMKPQQIVPWTAGR